VRVDDQLANDIGRRRRRLGGERQFHIGDHRCFFPRLEQWTRHDDEQFPGFRLNERFHLQSGDGELRPERQLELGLGRKLRKRLFERQPFGQ
jgi:hypothetical protein